MKWQARWKMALTVDSRESYRQAILSLLERNEAACVLDLGCGDGRRLARNIRTRTGTPFPIWGVDLNATSSHDLCVLRHNLETSLPFRSDTFNAVIASQIIEHVQHTDQLIREAYRVTKPGGYAIFSTPNLAAWHNVLYLSLGRQPETATVTDEMYPWKETPGHLRIFTATELCRLLTFHGFEVERLLGSTYVPFTGILARTLSKHDWRHAGTITIKVRKRRR